MAYYNTRLIARRGYSSRTKQTGGRGLSGVFDSIESGVKSAASSVLDFYGKEKQQEGANAALQAQNAALTQALAAQKAATADQGFLGLSTGELLLGVGGIAAVLLIARKK